jgi:hypothetical protein
MTRVNVTNQVVTGTSLPGLIFLVFLVLTIISACSGRRRR